MKPVSKEEFDAWLQANPQLESHVANFCEPPVRIYYDPDGLIPGQWPDVLGRVVLYEGYPKDGTPPYKWQPNKYEIKDQS